MDYPWSRKFALQHEILAYLQHCAGKHGLEPHIRTNSEVLSASFDEKTGRWEVKTKDATYCPRILIAAVGQLHQPSIPALPGLDSFSGVSFHSARWNHAHELAGKSVAVIGTGSTAIQVVPCIAPKVRKLTVFQRSPGYIRPKPEKVYSADEHEKFRRFPGLRRLDRLWTYCVNEARFINFDIAPLNRRMQGKFRAALAGRFADAEMRRKLTPDYALGCKRGLPSNDWYPTLARANVNLVTSPVTRIVPQGVETADGRVHAIDTLIFATGFKTTQFLTPIRIVGVDGRDLHQVWNDGAEAYLGMAVTGFPNLFLLYGPNTNLAHSSVVYMLESQFNYVLKAVNAMLAKGIDVMQVRPAVQKRYNEFLSRRLRRSVLVQGGCTSWFKTASGKVTNNWPTFSFLYRLRTRRLKLGDYEISRKTGYLEPEGIRRLHQ